MQSALYVASRFSLSEPLSLLLGTRLGDYRLSDTDHSVETGRVVPYADLVYDLDANYSLYASYTDIFMPQTYYSDAQNKLLEPDEGQNYEAGIKAKTKGYEAEISGELAPGWQVQAGFTHKVIRDEHNAKVSTWEPEDQFNLYTSYGLTGRLDKLTVGGGARRQGENWQVLNNRAKRMKEKFSQGSYWLVDMMARYQFTENLSAIVNVNNVFDKSYYTNIGFYNSAFYGEPRSFMVTGRWDFRVLNCLGW